MSQCTCWKTAVLAILPLLLIGTAPVFAGAPWIAVEMPPNPMNPETRKAALVVRLYYHPDPINAPITGTAEGVVDGKRQSLPLALERTSEVGVYTVKQTWPARGRWALVLHVTMHATISALVSLGNDGGVASERFHSMRYPRLEGASVRVLPRKATARDIAALLGKASG